MKMIISGKNVSTKDENDNIGQKYKYGG